MSPELLRYKSCTRKIAHSTFREAENHARRITHTGGPKYHAYKCCFEDHYHVGRKSRRLHSSLARKPRLSGRRFVGKKNRYVRVSRAA